LLIVLVLLPPSEGKAPPPRRGPPLDLQRLSFPSLSPAREQLLDLLATVSSRPDALARLGVGESLRPEVDANTGLRTSPTLPVGRLFTGVLYDALDLDGLDPAGRRRAARDVVVLSALWGALRLGDRVPPYRLSVTADLPGLGSLASWWRPRLAEPLQAIAGRGLVVDCRSSGYAAMWTPAGEAAERWVGVRVLREVGGHRTVVSHLAKLTRGRLTRHLLTAGPAVRTPEQLADVAALAFPVELTGPVRRGRAWTLDVVLREG
jgi:cytoplasmic iron level regulating protein YaaA (DUF328/UPF0246 family)